MRDNQAARADLSPRVSVGAFSGVEPELFRFAYDALSMDSPVRGARWRWKWCHWSVTVTNAGTTLR